MFPVRVSSPGGPTPKQARGPHWRRTSKGFYVPASVDPSVPEQRIVEQAMRVSDRGAITGWASLRLHGVGYLDGLEPDGRSEIRVRAVLRSGELRPDRALDVLRERVSESEVTTVRGVPVTSVPRALLDEMRRVAFVPAVVTMDMTSAAGLQTVKAQYLYVRNLRGLRGARSTLKALAWSRDGSRSPNETRLRLVWSLLAGLPEPLLNQSIYNEFGDHLATVDLFDPSSGLAAEFDGADHRTAHRHAADVAREDGLRRVGIEVVRVTGPDLRRSRNVADRLQAARQRALNVGPGPWLMGSRRPGWQPSVSRQQPAPPGH